MALCCTHIELRDADFGGPGSGLPCGDSCDCGNSTLLSVASMADAVDCGIFRTCSVSEVWRSFFSRCGLIRGSSNSTDVLSSRSLVLTYTQPIRSSAVNLSLRAGGEGGAEAAGKRQSDHKLAPSPACMMSGTKRNTWQQALLEIRTCPTQTHKSWTLRCYTPTQKFRPSLGSLPQA